MNTVRAFSSESQCVVRSGLWPWKPERCMTCVTMPANRSVVQRVHIAGRLAFLGEVLDEAFAEAFDSARVGVREDDVDVVALRLSSSITEKPSDSCAATTDVEPTLRR